MCAMSLNLLINRDNFHEKILFKKCTMGYIPFQHKSLIIINRAMSGIFERHFIVGHCRSPYPILSITKPNFFKYDPLFSKLPRIQVETLNKTHLPILSTSQNIFWSSLLKFLSIYPALKGSPSWTGRKMSNSSKTNPNKTSPQPILSNVTNFNHTTSWYSMKRPQSSKLHRPIPISSTNASNF